MTLFGAIFAGIVLTAIFRALPAWLGQVILLIFVFGICIPVLGWFWNTTIPQRIYCTMTESTYNWCNPYMSIYPKQ